jgi:plastocyanin domain-containing protein
VPYPLIEVSKGVKTRLFMMVDSKPVPIVAKQDEQHACNNSSEFPNFGTTPNWNG